MILPWKEEQNGWHFYIQNDIHAPDNGCRFYAESFADFYELLSAYKGLPDDRERGIFAIRDDDKLLIIRRVIEPDRVPFDVVDFTPIYHFRQYDHPLFEKEIRKAVEELNIQYGILMMKTMPIESALNGWIEDCARHKKSKEEWQEKMRLLLSDSSDGQP